MQNAIITKTEEAMRDKAFAEQLATAETVEAAQSLFASKGIDFTLDEVKQIGAGLKVKLGADELNAEQLDAVAGGIALATVVAVVEIVVGGLTIIDFVGRRAGWWD